jgi:alkyl hydroperoxide reductase subunit D
LACNNVTYRFRHFTGKPKYDELRMGLRMNIMMSPATGKEFFELMSLAVSAVNGCEMCVKSHEASLIALGATEERIWDAIRLSGVVVSLDRVVG